MNSRQPREQWHRPYQLSSRRHRGALATKLEVLGRFWTVWTWGVESSFSQFYHLAPGSQWRQVHQPVPEPTYSPGRQDVPGTRMEGNLKNNYLANKELKGILKWLYNQPRIGWILKRNLLNQQRVEKIAEKLPGQQWFGGNLKEWSPYQQTVEGFWKNKLEHQQRKMIT